MGQKFFKQYSQAPPQRPQKRKRDEQSEIIKPISDILKSAQDLEFLEKKIMIECLETKNIFVLLGEVHPEYSKLLVQSKNVGDFLHELAKSVKNISSSTNIYLLTESQPTLFTMENIYWANIHNNLKTNQETENRTDFTKITYCDIREEFLLKKLALLSNTFQNNIEKKLYKNNQQFINDLVDIIRKCSEIIQVSKDIIETPQNIFNHSPFKEKNVQDETKIKVTELIQHQLNRQIGSNVYKNVLNNFISQYENIQPTYFINNDLLPDEQKILDTDNLDQIKDKLLRYAEAQKDLPTEILTKITLKNGKVVDTITYFIEKIAQYFTILYSVIMDAEIIRNIKNIEATETNTLTIVYTGSEHTKVYEGLFNVVGCQQLDITQEEPREKKIKL